MEGSGTGSAVQGDGMLVTNCHVATRFCGFYYDKGSTEYKKCDNVKTAIDVISVNENVADFSNPKWFRDLEIIKESKNQIDVLLALMIQTLTIQVLN